MSDKVRQAGTDSPSQERPDRSSNQVAALARDLQQGASSPTQTAFDAAQVGLSVAEIKQDCFTFGATVAKSIGGALLEDLGFTRRIDSTKTGSRDTQTEAPPGSTQKLPADSTHPALNSARMLTPEIDEVLSGEFKATKRASRINEAVYVSPIDSAHSRITPDGKVEVVHQDGSRIDFDPSLRVAEIRGADGKQILRSHLTDTESRFIERHGNKLDLRDVAELHFRYRNHPGWINSCYTELSKLDTVNGAKPEQIDRLRGDLLANIAQPDKIEPHGANFGTLAQLERYVAANSPSTYASIIADAIKNNRIHAADSHIPIDRNVLLDTSAHENKASVVFQRACAHMLGFDSGWKYQPHGDGSRGRLHAPLGGSARDFAGANPHHIARLASNLTGTEHSVVRLASPDEHEKLGQAFRNRPIVLSEVTDNAPPAVVVAGGNHRVEWSVKDGAPHVIPGSAREVARNLELTDRRSAGAEKQTRVSAEHLMEVRAEEIHNALHKTNFGIPAADSTTVCQALGNMSKTQREALCRIYGAKFGTDNESSSSELLKRELRERLSSTDNAIVRSILDREDGKANDAGNTLVALAGVNEGRTSMELAANAARFAAKLAFADGQTELFTGNAILLSGAQQKLRNNEKLLVQQIGSMNSGQRHDLDAHLQQTGHSLQDSLLNNIDLTPATREALHILSKGTDKRTAEDVTQLAELAGRAHNVDLFAAAFGNNLPATTTARESFKKTHGQEWLDKQFSGHDRELARDYLEEGRVGLSTIARQSLQYFWNNKQDLIAALEHASDGERQQYARGRELSDRYRNADSSKIPPEEKADLQYYRKVRDALRSGTPPTNDREFAIYEDKLLRGGSLIAELAGKHSDGFLGQKWLFGGHKTNDLMTAVEQMSHSEFKRLKDPHYMEDFDKSLKSFCSAEERDRLHDLIWEKQGRVRWESSSQITRSLKDVISDNRNGSLGPVQLGREYDGKAIIDGIKSIGLQEREKYRDNAQYRAEIKQLLSHALVDVEKTLADRMLAQVERTGERPVFNKVEQVVYDSISPTQPIQVVHHIQEAFAADPSLRARLANPQNETDQDLNKAFRRALYHSVLEHNPMMSQAEERNLEDTLMANGFLSIGDRLRVCANSSERVRELTNCSKSEIPEVLNNHLGDGLPIIGAMLGQLNDNQRQYVREVLAVRSQEGNPDSLANQIRYHVVTGDADYSSLKESLRNASLSEREHARLEYATRYGHFLDKDLISSVGERERKEFEQILRTTAVDVKDDVFAGAQRAAQSRTGFADMIIATGHWDGSRDELTRQIDSTFGEIAQRTARHDQLDEESLRRRVEFVEQSRLIYKSSKEGVTDAALTAAYTAGGIAAATATGGMAAPLLIGALAGGIARPAIKSASEGEDFHPDQLQLTKEVFTGSVTGMLACVGTEQFSQVFKIGEKASAKAIASLSSTLGESTFKAGAKDAALAMAEKELAKKVQAGFGHIAEKDLDAVINKMISAGMKGELRPIVRAKLAHELEVNLEQGTRSYVEQLMLQARSPQLYKKLAGEASVGATSEAIQQSAIEIDHWDDKASFAENVRTLAERTGDAAVHGALAGLKASLIHFASTPGIDIAKKKALAALAENKLVQRYFGDKLKPEDALAASLYVKEPADGSGFFIPKHKDRPTILVQDQHGFTIEVPSNVEFTGKHGHKIHDVLPAGHFASRDGTIVNPEQARQRVTQLAAHQIPQAYQDRFHTHLNQIDARLCADHDPNSAAREIALVHHELSRLLGNDSGALDQPRSVWVAEQLARQIADPNTIEQGEYNLTCNVAVIESRMSQRQPSEYARMIAEGCIAGKFKTASGQEIFLADARTFEMPDELHARLSKRAALSPDDLAAERERSFASKIFQTTAANVRWKCFDGPIAGKHVDPGEVTYYFTGVSEMPLRNGSAMLGPNGFPLRGPQIESQYIQPIYEQITGRKEAPFVVQKRPTIKLTKEQTEHLSMNQVLIKDEAELRNVLQRLHAQQALPAVLVVDQSKNPFDQDFRRTHSAIPTVPLKNIAFPPEAHVVLGWQNDAGIEVYNSWGKASHHLDSEALPLSDFYKGLYDGL